ncbi:hypothetical protein EV385_5383 [Krasilnikovia cinnamomea]|uniref:Uncharacterized protein n=2 Tax=Krasilnikovia cinnamomea TaxID=349313 RepID=A0A4V2G7Q0_9ACTN|nr:hypothetical protein EV385_5383 [Krasilnikovia cinnamomea]
MEGVSARLTLTEDEAAVGAAVGVRAFVQARSTVTRSELTSVHWNRATSQAMPSSRAR